jgi:hypothetical protein
VMSLQVFTAAVQTDPEEMSQLSINTWPHLSRLSRIEICTVDSWLTQQEKILMLHHLGAVSMETKINIILPALSQHFATTHKVKIWQALSSAFDKLDLCDSSEVAKECGLHNNLSKHEHQKRAYLTMIYSIESESCLSYSRDYPTCPPTGPSPIIQCWWGQTILGSWLFDYFAVLLW